MTNIDNLKLNGIIFALFLISLDAYSFGNIPIQWIGLAVLLFLFILNFKKITSNFSSISYIFMALVIVPIFFEIFSDFEILLERNYQLRLFNYLSFFLVIYVSHSFLQSIDHKLFMDLLEKLLIIISVITIYIYISQIFDLYEPIRNRSNTNLLGNAAYADLSILVKETSCVFTPSDAAVTSITTLSVSISAKPSSCLIASPVFFNQVDKVPSKMDSGNWGDFMSSAIVNIL